MKKATWIMVAAIALIASFASADGIWDGSLEPNSGLNDPQWALVVTGGSYTQGAGEGTIDVTGSGRMYRLGNPAIPEWNHTATGDSVIEFRMKVDSIEAGKTYGAGFIFLTDTTVGGAYRWRELWFAADHVKARYGASTGELDTSEYHDYKVVIDAGDAQAHLYVDGQTTSSMDWSGTNGGGDREWMDLGSNNASVKGVSTWDSLSWENNIPEPATASLLALVGGGLFYVRKRFSI